MPGTPNPLRDMGSLDSVVVSKDERPNPSFETSALPGFKKTVQSRRAKIDGNIVVSFNSDLHSWGAGF